MKTKIDLAFEVLNRYDYEMGKSTQEGLWLIHEMERIFSNKESLKRKDRKVASKEIKAITIGNQLNSFKDRNSILEFDGSQYVIPNHEEDKDGSFNYHVFVFIQEDDKLVRLCVRALGKDVYGDRIYPEADYFNYSDSRMNWSYHSVNRVSRKGKYEKHINKVIELIRELKYPDFDPLKELNKSH
jgi:hypothetical protein